MGVGENVSQVVYLRLALGTPRLFKQVDVSQVHWAAQVWRTGLLPFSQLSCGYLIISPTATSSSIFAFEGCPRSLLCHTSVYPEAYGTQQGYGRHPMKHTDRYCLKSIRLSEKTTPQVESQHLCSAFKDQSPHPPRSLSYCPQSASERWAQWIRHFWLTKNGHQNKQKKTVVPVAFLSESSR